MMTWPDNKRIAVMMAFDLDAETMWTTRGDGNHDHITNLSRGAYGPKQRTQNPGHAGCVWGKGNLFHSRRYSGTLSPGGKGNQPQGP